MELLMSRLGELADCYGTGFFGDNSSYVLAFDQQKKPNVPRLFVQAISQDSCYRRIQWACLQRD